MIKGIIDEYTQAPFYPEFANHNTYGIKAVNDTVYNYMKFATNMIGGCLDQINYCRATNRTSPADLAICSEAQSMCRDNVESPYYNYGGRGVYDIRHPIDDPTPPEYFTDYLNLPEVQNALGGMLNEYTWIIPKLIAHSRPQLYRKQQRYLLCFPNNGRLHLP